MKLVPVVCLCLLSRSGGSSADGNGPAVLKVEEGSDVILPCSLSTNQDIGSGLFYWKKVAQGDQPYKEVFMYEGGRHSNNGLDGQSEQFKGRVIHFPADLKHGNASILITNTKVDDSGNYTCDFPRLQPRQIFTVELVVGAVLKDRTEEKIPGAAPEPSVTSVDEGQDWSLLQCVVRGASPQPKVEWKDSSGNLLPAQQPQVSQRGGRYDIILQTTVTKTGRYRCVATQETINHQIHAEIYVYIGGAAPEPSVTILDQTDDGMLLQCVVRGAPPQPKVEWKDSSGNLLPIEQSQVLQSGDRYDIILRTTVTKTGRYRCVATQETINHQIHAEIYVPVNESPTGAPAGWIVAAVLVAVLVVVALVAKGYIPLKCTKGSPPETSVPLQDPGLSDQGPEVP